MKGDWDSSDEETESISMSDNAAQTSQPKGSKRKERQIRIKTKEAEDEFK